MSEQDWFQLLGCLAILFAFLTAWVMKPKDQRPFIKYKRLDPVWCTRNMRVGYDAKDVTCSSKR